MTSLLRSAEALIEDLSIEFETGEDKTAAIKLCEAFEENRSHMKLHGTHGEGEKHSQAKLNEEQVRAIIDLRQEGLTLQQIASKYGVSSAAVSLIIRRQTWKHLNVSPA